METRAGGTGAAIKIRPGNEGRGGQAFSREVRRATNPVEGEERKAESGPPGSLTCLKDFQQSSLQMGLS